MDCSILIAFSLLTWQQEDEEVCGVALIKALISLMKSPLL